MMETEDQANCASLQFTELFPIWPADFLLPNSITDMRVARENPLVLVPQFRQRRSFGLKDLNGYLTSRVVWKELAGSSGIIIVLSTTRP